MFDGQTDLTLGYVLKLQRIRISMKRSTYFTTNLNIDKFSFAFITVMT